MGHKAIDLLDGLFNNVAVWNEYLFDGVRESGKYPDAEILSVSIPKIA